ncbi:tryptophan synthase subunit alpha [Campylobacter sp. MIT 21-1685]|uniref:tryptophan synthase subunit alpha n=1 Tax=unclassified Campylobacter TaxID=2593542 RepID=UPI00224B13E5|nr:MULTISPECIES: tryptophan synthase subunit alpha [unclassified Campylobacter]MCX2683478.1 tryptophan synthase subunit alpha [Campylobacter sp. MIT 21-1684]MCX2751759.1 tryptophan synthase subunit alpha [Campylobacter sp. MIT 21-1682]MCX2807960.1 tryptophan synthase subunit alpha [Campylobacter sp. MIT 21-1685]
MVDFRTHYKHNANIAYTVIGYPNLELSKKFLNALDESGIDILEVGVPYSDPLADGEIIANAAAQALKQGVTIHTIFTLFDEITTKKTLVLMVYYNVIFSYGIKQFVQKAKKAGFCALIVPELNFEESMQLSRECEKYDLALITLVSVTTPKKRVAQLVKNAKGFIYLLASVGITGGKSVQKTLLKEKIQQIRTYTKLPIFIGFGVKNNKDVKEMRELGDGVIVGTAVVDFFKEAKLEMVMKNIQELFKN